MKCMKLSKKPNKKLRKNYENMPLSYKVAHQDHDSKVL